MASVLRTSSGAFLTILLPAVVIRSVGSTSYGVWALSVEIGTYLGLLDLGALSAIGHFIARVPEHDSSAKARVIATMLAIQCSMIAVGLLLLATLIVVLPVVYPGMPRSLVPSGRLALALVGGSALTSLLPATLTGYLLSIHQAVKPALIVFASRFLGTLAILALALRGFGISGFALAWAGAALAGQCSIVLLFTRLRLPVRPGLVSWPLARRVIGYCGAYTIWIVAGLLVVGLDTTIVAWVDFSSVAAYAAAAGAVSIVGAVYSSALAPMVPMSARLAAENQRAALGGLLLRLIRWGGLAVVLASACLALGAEPLLRLWLGPETADRGARLLQILVAANALRLLILPYPMLLFATGEHRRIWTTPLLEGFINVVVSVVLSRFMGPVGVAVGTLVGAVFGVTCHVWLNLPRTLSIDVDPRILFRTSMVGPLLAATPTAAVLLIEQFAQAGPEPALRIAAVLVTAAIIWRVTLSYEERAMARSGVISRLPGSGARP